MNAQWAAKRERDRGPLWPARVVAAALLLLSGACTRHPAEQMIVAREVELPDTASSGLFLQHPDSIWLAAPGRLALTDSTGALRFRWELETPDTPEILGVHAGALYYRAGLRIGRVDLTAGTGTEVEAIGEAFALDPRARFLLRTTVRGAIIAQDGTSLEPRWGWADLGGPGTAIAFAPQGHRLVQAIATSGEEPARIFLHDVQSGRIVERLESEGEMRALFLTPEGAILALLADERGSLVRAWRWEEGELREAWRRPLERSGFEPPARATLAPSGRLLAVLMPDEQTGLLILDAETGAILRKAPGPARDVGFDALDRVHLLTRGELRRLE